MASRRFESFGPGRASSQMSTTSIVALLSHTFIKGNLVQIEASIPRLEVAMEDNLDVDMIVIENFYASASNEKDEALVHFLETKEAPPPVIQSNKRKKKFSYLRVFSREDIY